MFKRKEERMTISGGGGANICKGTSKLHQVFSKLSGVLPPPKTQELGGNATKTMMTTDIIESAFAAAAAAADESSSPLPQPPSCCNYDLSLLSSSPLLAAADDKTLYLTTIISLNNRLEMALRATKTTHLLCNHVLLPCGLLYRISCDILSMAESEPCGIRGCSINVNFETIDLCRKLTTVKCDPHTATTFELNLTLKQQQTTSTTSLYGWTTFVPQFLKNLTRGGGGGGGTTTIVVNPTYTLSKKKLYRSILD